MLAPEKCPILVLSKEAGISQSTLPTWKSKDLGNVNSNKQGRPSKKLSTRDTFLVVMETYSMSKIELSEYCTTNGYYVDDVKAWRNSCIVANDVQNEDSNELREELTKEKKKAKELEREIRVKDKALAETTALLVLKKSQMRFSGI